MSALIPLTKGQFAVVDDADYERVNAISWYAQKHGRTYYAVANSATVNGKRHSILMHRFLLVVPEGYETDHIDGDGLNNCRSNLRAVTHAENSRHRLLNCNNKTGFYGVSWHGARGKYQATIRIDGKQRHLGLFSDPVEAAAARDKAAREHYKDFGRLNGCSTTA